MLENEKKLKDRWTFEQKDRQFCRIKIIIINDIYSELFRLLWWASEGQFSIQISVQEHLVLQDSCCQNLHARVQTE